MSLTLKTILGEISMSVDYVQAAVAAAATGLNLSSGGIPTGPMTVDGIAVSNPDVVLLTGQSNAANNGPWTVQNFIPWTRPGWYTGSIESISISVMSGTA